MLVWVSVHTFIFVNCSKGSISKILICAFRFLFVFGQEILSVRWRFQQTKPTTNNTTKTLFPWFSFFLLTFKILLNVFHFFQSAEIKTIDWKMNRGLNHVFNFPFFVLLIIFCHTRLLRFYVSHPSNILFRAFSTHNVWIIFLKQHWNA